ncbi:ABC transporter permease [Mesorhizobium sp. B3-1-3]|uniref:ABC transporter permease n=1 Tax=unclassified Mesorhizobium TaxID=325217 RepID=UPI00112EFAAA|nr:MULTISPECIES: ABC transporter permease [unclassified Mesorhizobium]TPI56049.1 ABC transporter permease [Mesorhizobium sp. B3-1-8]TPI63343.1 ABC transporter permease [Mesorhizobium sp. B3-1-3]
MGVIRKQLLVLPSVAFLVVFLLLPLATLGIQSFPNGSFDIYLHIFSQPLYLSVFKETFRSAVIVTGVCLFLGYPYALLMTRGNRATVILLSIALLLPFWVSLLLRTFSWVILLQNTGVLNELLQLSGLIGRPVPLIRNSTGVIVGMTHILLPNMVLPILAVMSRIDFSLLDAANICGATGLRRFTTILVPLTLPGIVAGSVLCFTLSLGFYITPAMLGGPANTMVAQLIASQVNDQFNVPVASALSVVLLGATALCFLVVGLAMWWSRRWSVTL